MKSIIAPTDFSDTASNALSFAAELAERAKALLIVVHVRQKKEDVEKTESKLKSIQDDLKKSHGDGLKIERQLAHGNLVTALKKIITEHEPDLIVMGTKGAGGLKRILIGSNTVNVIAKIKQPVLIIPETARFSNFNKRNKNRIVLAADLDELENENAINILKKIAFAIDKPKVRVLNVRPKKTRLSELSKLERSFLLSVFSPEIESEKITVFSSNVMSGINFYLDKHTDTGLLAMIARDTGQLIQKHYTRQMASQIHLPMLVIHDE